jgi:tRNA (guanine-N7-)-methyltransferase
MYDPVERRNFYGRVHGKTLRASQKTYLEEDLGKLSLAGVTREENPERTPIELSRFEGKPLWLEIGFGGGEHLVHMAATYPEIGIIGCEPFVNGIAMSARSAASDEPAIHRRCARLVRCCPRPIAKAFLNYSRPLAQSPPPPPPL